MTEHPEKFKEKIDEFYRTDVTEKEKAENFLNLIMEDSNDRQINMDRWQSVKDSKVFEKNSQKGFAQNRFQKEEFKQIAIRTPADRVKSAYIHIKEILTRTNEKGDLTYDR